MDLECQAISPYIQYYLVTLDQISAYSYHNHQQNLFLIVLLCGKIVTILLLTFNYMI